MAKKIQIFCCIALLFIIAFSLRIYKVGSSPSGTLVDEASFGYNAYSLLQTGNDEHGIPHPLIFKAFGDQKLPIYAYSTIPFVKLLGLNNLSVRFSSVLAGSILGVVLFLFFLEAGFSIGVSFLASLIASLSPWSLTLSRFGYEANVGLLFFVTGLYFSFRAKRNNSIYFALLAGLFMGATWYSYIAYRIVTFIIMALLVLLYFFRQKKLSRPGITFIASFLITVSPFLPSFFSPQSTARLRQSGLITNMGIVMTINENRTFCSTRAPKILCYLSSNKPLSYTGTYFSRFSTALSSHYLFVSGDKGVTYLNVDNYGLFYAVFLPFYLIGLLALGSRFLKGKATKLDILLFAGLVVAPLPSVLAGDPQKVRLSPLFPFIILSIAYGIDTLDKSIKSPVCRKACYIVSSSAAIIFAVFFMVNFITLHTVKYETTFGTYIPKLMQYLGRQDKKTKIYIKSPTDAIILYAFVNKTDPGFYQKNIVRTLPDEIGFAQPIQLGNVYVADQDMHATYCKTVRSHDKALYVTNEDFRTTLGADPKIIWSENGVDTLAFIYDLNTLKEGSFDCSYIK